jgi:uncharacterized protein (TIGR03066 family)
MRTWTAVLAAAAVVLVFGIPAAPAADKPKELIVGKWEPTNENGKGFVAEFTKDGKVVIAGKKDGQEIKVEGTYKFLTDDTMELNLEFMGEKKTEKLTITKIDKEEMVTEDSMKKEEKFKRLK